MKNLTFPWRWLSGGRASGLLLGCFLFLGSALELWAQTPARTLLAPDRVAYYPRLIRLQHSGVANGRLIASFDNGNTGAIYESTNEGSSWQSVGNITETTPPRNCCSGLYEVPQQLGATAPGTLLWATSVGTDQGSRGPSSIRVYRSADMGRTWSFLATAVSGTTGLWEAEFGVDNQGRLIMYFSSEEYKAQSYNQVLSHRVSTDGGLTWSPDVMDVGVADNAARPGMPVVRRLPNGSYVMTYEVCGTRGCDAYIRTSPNGTDWGDPTNLGTRIESTAGHHFSHAPTVSFAADGTPNGKLLAIGQEMRNNSDNRVADLNGKVIMVNTNNGVGPWTEIAAPVEVPGARDNPCPNYSSQVLPSADGTSLLEIALDFSNGECRAFYNTGSITAPPNTAFAPASIANGVYRLVSKNSGRALDVDKCATENGANVQQFDWLGGDCQRWQLEALGDGYYKITSQNSGRVLDVAACSKDNLANVQQYDWLNNDCQKWRIEQVGGSFYRLVNKNSGRVLDVDACSTENFGNVQQFEWLGGDCQRWGFELVEPGYYKIISKNSGRVLDVDACSKENGANVQQYEWLGGDCQRWQLTPVVAIVTATDQRAGAATLSVYPNPAASQLTIKQTFDKTTTLRLMLRDGVGRTQRTGTRTALAGPDTWTLDVGGLAAGIYTLRLEYDGQSVTQKVAIQP